MRSLLLIALSLSLAGCAIRYDTPDDGGPGFERDLGLRETVWGKLQVYENLRTEYSVPPMFPPGYMSGVEPLEAEVKAFLLIEPDGSVSAVSLFRTSRYSDIDAAALKAFKKWGFPPQAENTQRVSVSRMTFRLNMGH